MKIARIALTALICLALLLPACASAEGTESFLRIANPVITMNGDAMLDLTGLSFELDTAKTEELVGMIVKIMGGDEVAMKAIATLDTEKLLLAVDGLEQVYGLNLAGILNSMSEKSSGLTQEALMKITADALTILGDVAAPLMSFDMTKYTTDGGDEEFDGVTYHRTDVNIDSDTIDALIVETLTALDNHKDLVNGIIAAAGATGTTFEGTLTDSYKNYGPSFSLQGSSWYADEKVRTDNYVLTIADKNGESFGMEYYCDMSIDAETANEITDFEFNLFNGEKKTYGIGYSIVNTPVETGSCIQMTMTAMNYAESEDGVSVFDMYISCVDDGDGATDMYCTLEMSGITYEYLVSSQTGDTNTFTASGVLTQGETEMYRYDLSGEYAFGDASMLNMTMTYEMGGQTIEAALNYEGAVSADDPNTYAGTLTGTVTAAGVEYGLTLDVATGSGDADLAEYAIDGTNMIDFMSMDEAAQSQLKAGLTTVATNALTVLQTAIPSIAAMMGAAA